VTAAHAKVRGEPPWWPSRRLWYPASVTARRVASEKFVCELDVELDTGRVRVIGRARDINESALCLVAKDPLEPGQKVQVHLRLALEWGTSEVVVVPGLVAWLTPSEGTQQIGVVFNIITPDIRQRLSVLMKVMLGQISLPSPGN
jgi:hypothetical protein